MPRESAERLRRSLRSCDTLARIGRDEFGLLLKGVVSREAAERSVCRIVATLDRPFLIDGREVSVQASFGVALYPDDSSDTRELFHQADLAMYAKRAAADAQTQGASVSAYTLP
ncbi:MAG: diguanylate cyclase domain-containing protein [Vulcanimicrobiaceae bacterium]